MDTPIHLFTDTVKIVRPTLGTDDAGFPTKTSYALHLTISARVSKTDFAEGDRAGGRRIVRSIRIYTEAGQDILSTDRAWFDGGIYELVQQTPRHTPFNAASDVYSLFDGTWIQDESEPV